MLYGGVSGAAAAQRLTTFRLARPENNEIGYELVEMRRISAMYAVNFHISRALARFLE